MAGGDGSQALIATVASRHGIPHVVVPAGTRNHFALDLGLDRDDVVGALDAFSDAVERTIDLATVNGRVFVNNASLGLYAKIVQAPEYRDAKMRTAAAMLPDLLGPDAEPLDLRFAGPDGHAHETRTWCWCPTTPTSSTTCPAGAPGSGSTWACSAWSRPASTGSGGRAVRRAERRRPDPQVPGLAGVVGPQFRIDSGGPVEIGIDGEAMTLDAPLVFESLPAALRVRLPGHAPGVSPAARRVSSSTVGELWALVAGHGAGSADEPTTPR